MRLATQAGMGKREKQYVGRLERELLIRVTLPPLDKNNIFQLAKRRSILTTIPSQIDVTCPKQHTKVLQGHKGNPVAQDDSQLNNIIHVANND